MKNMATVAKSIPTVTSIMVTEDPAETKTGSKVIYYGRMSSVEAETTEKAEDEFAAPVEGPLKFDLSTMKSMFVDVIVKNAVSPLNFTIQNYRQSKHLKQLENEMTAFYVQKNLTVLKFSDLTLHGFYAVKYSAPNSNSTQNSNSTAILSKDNPIDENNNSDCWVRCQIMKPFNENMPVLTYLTDHGVYHVTEPACIQPLKKSFLLLPVQAYEAKLHFVEVIKNQFTPEDCMRFQKEVEGKPFCAILLSKVPQNSDSKKNSNEDKLSVILIDTSTTRDDYIHQHFGSNKSRLLKGRS